MKMYLCIPPNFPVHTYECHIYRYNVIIYTKFSISTFWYYSILSLRFYVQYHIPGYSILENVANLLVQDVCVCVWGGDDNEKFNKSYVFISLLNERHIRYNQDKLRKINIQIYYRCSLVIRLCYSQTILLCINMCKNNYLRSGQLHDLNLIYFVLCNSKLKSNV